MGKLVVSEFTSLDGVMEEPGKWSLEFPRSDAQMESKTDELLTSDALLIGRVTYEGFAADWPSMLDDPVGYRKRMNGIPEYVVSSTLKKVGWKNSRLVKGDLVTEVKKPKAQMQRDILVFGGLRLSSQLLHHGLVDEQRPGLPERRQEPFKGSNQGWVQAHGRQGSCPRHPAPWIQLLKSRDVEVGSIGRT